MNERVGQYSTNETEVETKMKKIKRNQKHCKQKTNVNETRETKMKRKPKQCSRKCDEKRRKQ